MLYVTLSRVGVVREDCKTHNVMYSEVFCLSSSTAATVAVGIVGQLMWMW